MFCDAAINEEELYQAFLLYASLHGLSTSEEEVRERIARYLNNTPDETIDAAILAFAEDRIVAPPDVILAHWGKSRVYELDPLPCGGGWRHQVCESWFEGGCRFIADAPVRLSHYWTKLTSPSVGEEIRSGTRCSLQMTSSGEVHVLHRCNAILGHLPEELAAEMLATASEENRYLALIDLIDREHSNYTLLITRALAAVPAPEMVEYAANAFISPRNKC
jgi:hypothetical protein